MTHSSPQSTESGLRTKTPVKRSQDNDPGHLTDRVYVVIGFAATVFGCLFAVGFVFLPVSTLPEKAFVFLACLALSVATITGIGAWRSGRRFSITASLVGLALICLSALSVTAAGRAVTRIQPSSTTPSNAPTAPSYTPDPSSPPHKSASPTSTDSPPQETPSPTHTHPPTLKVVEPVEQPGWTLEWRKHVSIQPQGIIVTGAGPQVGDGSNYDIAYIPGTGWDINNNTVEIDNWPITIQPGPSTINGVLSNGGPVTAATMAQKGEELDWMSQNTNMDGYIFVTSVNDAGVEAEMWVWTKNGT